MMSFNFKFLPVKDLIFSGIPTIGTYAGYLQGVSPNILDNKYLSIGIGLLASIVLAVIFYRENVKAYKKDLAEILATGYFMNFTGKLGSILKSKVPVRFQFPDETVKSILPENIKVEIGIPESIDGLKEYSEHVSSNTEILYVREASLSEPFWLRGKLENETLLIYEYPRTLFAITKYLKAEFANIKKSKKRSKKIYKYFAEQIEELKVEFADQIPHSKFIFKNI